MMYKKNMFVQYPVKISISYDILVGNMQTELFLACLAYINADILDRNPRIINCVSSHITMARTFCFLC